MLTSASAAAVVGSRGEFPLDSARFDASHRALIVMPTESAIRADGSTHCDVSVTGAFAVFERAPIASGMDAAIIIAFFGQFGFDDFQLGFDTLQAPFGCKNRACIRGFISLDRLFPVTGGAASQQ